MEMNWITALLGLIIVALCVLPFVMMHYHWAKKEKKMLQSLQEIAQKQDSSIDQHEFCGSFVMGIDTRKNFLFFFKQKKEGEIAQCINLSETRTCQVLKKQEILPIPPASTLYKD